MADTPRQDTPETVELPAPTAWPLIAAAGVALIFAGLVTHVMVTVVGIVLGVRGAVGWWYDVFPEPNVEFVPLRAAARRAQPVQPAKHAVAHLIPGVGQHRVRIPAEVHPYSAGIWGGIAGGIAMAALAEVYGVLATGSLWYPINLLAAAVMPSLSSANIAQLMAFNSTAFLIALGMHATISLFVGLIYAVTLPMFPRHPAIWGGLLGPLFWSGLLWTLLDIINPPLNALISWRWFVASQIAFGLAAGFVVARTQKIGTMQTWPLAVRMGIEAPGMGEEHEP